MIKPFSGILQCLPLLLHAKVLVCSHLENETFYLPLEQTCSTTASTLDQSRHKVDDSRPIFRPRIWDKSYFLSHDFVYMKHLLLKWPETYLQHSYFRLQQCQHIGTIYHRYHIVRCKMLWSVDEKGLYSALWLSNTDFNREKMVLLVEVACASTIDWS